MKHEKCSKCDGDGGWPANENRPVKLRYDWDDGEDYRTNWTDCDECGGSGEVEVAEEE